MEKKNLTWTFISDNESEITKSFKVFLSDETEEYDKWQPGHAIPSKFLINKDGIIAWKYVGSRKDRPTEKILIDAIEHYL